MIVTKSIFWNAALDTAFSSLYRDDVHLTSKHILPTVAAANMLQMVCLISQLHLNLVNDY